MPSFHLDPDDFRPVIDQAVDAAFRRLNRERPDSPKKRLLPKDEAAKTLSLSVSSLDRITHPKGDLRPVRLDGRVLFAQAEIERWIAAKTAGEEGGAE